MLAILHNILCGFGHVRGGLKSSIGLLNHKESGSKSKGKGFFLLLILWSVVGRRASNTNERLKNR